MDRPVGGIVQIDGPLDFFGRSTDYEENLIVHNTKRGQTKKIRL